MWIAFSLVTEILFRLDLERPFDRHRKSVSAGDGTWITRNICTFVLCHSLSCPELSRVSLHSHSSLLSLAPLHILLQRVVSGADGAMVIKRGLFIQDVFYQSLPQCESHGSCLLTHGDRMQDKRGAREGGWVEHFHPGH